MSGLTIFNFLIGLLAFTLVLVALFNLFYLSAKCKYLCGCNKKCCDSDCFKDDPTGCRVNVNKDCCTPCNKDTTVKCFTIDEDKYINSISKECTPCKCKK